MKLKPRLLFYAERDTKFNDKIRAEFFKYSLPFIEISDGIELLNALASHNFNIIMRIDSQDLYNKVVNIVNKEQISASSFMIIHENPTFSASQYQSTNNIDEIVRYILLLSANNKINMQPPTPSIVQRILAMEMEKVGISKSYIGFKYLVDLLVLNVLDRQSLISLDEKFEKLAILNNISKECIERDLRHMLNSCWKNSDTFRDTLLNFNKSTFTINFKNLISVTIKYFISLF